MISKNRESGQGLRDVILAGAVISAIGILGYIGWPFLRRTPTYAQNAHSGIETLLTKAEKNAQRARKTEDVKGTYHRTKPFHMVSEDQRGYLALLPGGVTHFTHEDEKHAFFRGTDYNKDGNIGAGELEISVGGTTRQADTQEDYDIGNHWFNKLKDEACERRDRNGEQFFVEISRPYDMLAKGKKGKRY